MDVIIENSLDIDCAISDNIFPVDGPVVDGIYKIQVEFKIRYKMKGKNTIIEKRKTEQNVLQVSKKEKMTNLHMMFIKLDNVRKIRFIFGTKRTQVTHYGFDIENNLQINLKCTWRHMEESRKLNEMCLQMKKRILDTTDEFLFRPKGPESAKVFQQMQQEIMNCI